MLNLKILLNANQKVCVKSRNMFPWDVKKLWKKPKEGPNASKKHPRELPRSERRPRKSRNEPQEGAWEPKGAPEAQQAIFVCSKAFFGSPLETPLGEQWRRANSVIWNESATLVTKMAHWKTKVFSLFLMNTCKNHCFFNAKPLSTPARRPPQEGP